METLWEPINIYIWPGGTYWFIGYSESLSEPSSSDSASDHAGEPNPAHLERTQSRKVQTFRSRSIFGPCRAYDSHLRAPRGKTIPGRASESLLALPAVSIPQGRATDRPVRSRGRCATPLRSAATRGERHHHLHRRAVTARRARTHFNLGTAPRAGRAHRVLTGSVRRRPRAAALAGAAGAPDSN